MTSEEQEMTTSKDDVGHLNKKRKEKLSLEEDKDESEKQLSDKNEEQDREFEGAKEMASTETGGPLKKKRKRKSRLDEDKDGSKKQVSDKYEEQDRELEEPKGTNSKKKDKKQNGKGQEKQLANEDKKDKKEKVKEKIIEEEDEDVEKLQKLQDKRKNGKERVKQLANEDKKGNKGKEKVIEEEDEEVEKLENLQADDTKKYISNLLGIVRTIKGINLTEIHLDHLRKYCPFYKLIEAIKDGKLPPHICRKNENDIRNILSTYKSEEGSFNFDGESKKLTSDHIRSIFGICDGRKILKLGAQRRPDESRFYKRYFNTVGRALYTGPVTSGLLKATDIENVGKNKFVKDTTRLLTLYILQSCMVPKRNSCIQWSYVRLVLDVEQLIEYDWSGHIHKTLITSLDSEESIDKKSGCIIAIPYWFMETFPFYVPENPAEEILCIKWKIPKLSKETKEKSIIELSQKSIDVSQTFPESVAIEESGSDAENEVVPETNVSKQGILNINDPFSLPSQHIDDIHKEWAAPTLKVGEVSGSSQQSESDYVKLSQQNLTIMERNKVLREELNISQRKLALKVTAHAAAVKRENDFKKQVGDLTCANADLSKKVDHLTCTNAELSKTIMKAANENANSRDESQIIADLIADINSAMLLVSEDLMRERLQAMADELVASMGPVTQQNLFSDIDDVVNGVCNDIGRMAVANDPNDDVPHSKKGLHDSQEKGQEIVNKDMKQAAGKGLYESRENKQAAEKGKEQASQKSRPLPNPFTKPPRPRIMNQAKKTEVATSKAPIFRVNQTAEINKISNDETPSFDLLTPSPPDEDEDEDDSKLGPKELMHKKAINIILSNDIVEKLKLIHKKGRDTTIWRNGWRIQQMVMVKELYNIRNGLVLSDNVMDAYCSMLVEEINRSTEKVVILDSRSWRYITGGKDYEITTRNLVNQPLSEKTRKYGNDLTKIIVPVLCNGGKSRHVEPHHWTLIVFDVASKTWFYYNSLKTYRKSGEDLYQMDAMRVKMHVEDVFKTIIKNKGGDVSEYKFKSKFVVKTEEVAQQAVSSLDCGVIVAYWITCLLRANEIPSNVVDDDVLNTFKANIITKVVEPYDLETNLDTTDISLDVTKEDTSKNFKDEDL